MDSFFTGGKKKGLIWLWKKLNFFVFKRYVLNREERITQKEIARIDVTRAFHVRNTVFLPILTSKSWACTGPRWGERNRCPTFCAASSWIAMELRGHAINLLQQQVTLRRAAKERLQGRRMSVHHRWVTFFWKKLQVRKRYSLETLQAYFLDNSSLLWQKKRFYAGHEEKFPLQNFFPLFQWFFDMKPFCWRR